MKAGQFQAWASKTSQHAQYVARETQVKQLLADNTIDSLHGQVEAMKDEKTAHEIMTHVRKTWCPLRKRELTDIVQNFQAGRINDDGDSEPGLDEGQSYWEFIHKLDAERRYVQSM